MSLIPDANERLSRARADLRIGLPVLLRDADRLVLILAVETLSAERLQSLAEIEGQPHLAITARRAETLKARPYDGDLARIVLPRDAGLTWLNAVADPADDLRQPMKGPLVALRDGEADLDRLSLRILKSARLLPAALNLAVAEAPPGLTEIDASATRAVLDAASPLHPVIAARVPLAAAENARLHVFRPEDGGEEHYAIEIGRPPRDKPVLARLHSACFTGDLLGSLKCDCGPQLRGALAQMGAEGNGILLYLNQEGRGIGLANKMRAYSLQDQGFDTVEANHRLGFEDDERDFRLGAALLKDLGFSAVRLLTNNPNKIAMMERAGIAVPERVPLKVGENPHNAHYLATKAKKSGHLL
ncbi:3,4-dihydroxy-2-butanone 4-phosphate synthase/GTP cyclohydrolase II [Pseudooceanicola batsensis HTCC2597]|uniref:GTP cyclohydrolase-2 n=1 Tax=Pseudooceanicola batsensis (strain ATCC BAA-863 / DSM 15984 / KCTC 12145 / HTCC2597) TaxID=252305 RepID=A3TW72_PSEBH|nr:GTP cyclohydrolase II [Pseudooceanicola batsensis]EAQ03868.1 3,4-dihydroxy-2-butanone 4-phosphate synthase/GTP cyclohydrolase II [Pseudooceanicola batsensis HTCC2597]